MPLVATSPAPFGAQQARFSAPQLLHLWVATASLALPLPAVVHSLPHPPQRCCTTLLVVWPMRALAPAPFGLVSACANQASLHLAHAMEVTVAESAVVVVLRSSNCARSLGEAVMPSSPVGLYWALAVVTVAKTPIKTVAKPRRELRTILVISFIVF